MEELINTLVDELREAEKVANDPYSYGYYDGIAMALSILRKLID